MDGHMSEDRYPANVKCQWLRVKTLESPQQLQATACVSSLFSPYSSPMVMPYTKAKSCLVIGSSIRFICICTLHQGLQAIFRSPKPVSLWNWNHWHAGQKKSSGLGIETGVLGLLKSIIWTVVITQLRQRLNIQKAVGDLDTKGVFLHRAFLEALAFVKIVGALGSCHPERVDVIPKEWMPGSHRIPLVRKPLQVLPTMAKVL